MNTHDPNNPNVQFGAFLRSTRKATKITGRDAATAAAMLPSNFSKLEHGALNPPQDPEKLRRLASCIGLRSGSEEEATFFDLAAKANGSVPVDLADIISEHEAVPLLLRTIGNKRLTSEEIQKLVQLVRGR